MNHPLQEFMTARLPFPALASWTARLPDRTITSQSFMDWAPVARSEQIFSRLMLAANGLRQHDLQPVRLCWAFELARFYLAVRADGACLMLIVHNLRDLSTTMIEALLDDFVSLGV